MKWIEIIVVTYYKLIFTKGIPSLWNNRNKLSLIRKTLFGSYRNKQIRFSLAYLFRIKIPETNKYLLVLNRRIENQLQPVGGVYKRYGDDKLFEKWNYVPDNKKNGLSVDKDSEDDLRFRVDGKNTLKVIKWFEEGKEREVSGEREFNEELISTNILDRDNFKQIKYKHIKRVSKNLEWSDFHSCYEILIHDIFELIPTETQKTELIKLNQSEVDLTNGYAVVDCDDIEQLRLIKNEKQIARIGEHTKFTINKI